MSPEAEAVLAQLRPYPEDGTRADGPVAVDATDRLLLDEAAGPISAGTDRVVVIGDRFGALSLGCLALGARQVDVQTDAITAEAALDANSRRVNRTLWDGHVANTADPHDPAPLGMTVHDALAPGLLRGARLVLLQLPPSLAELTEVAEYVARYADSSVTLLAGGRVKHMTHAMNDVLGASFEQVGASLARQKSRLLIARGPRTAGGPLTYPVTARIDDREVLHAATPRSAAGGRTGPAALTVVAHGAAFAGAGLDLGTRFLLAQADRWPDLPSTGTDAAPARHHPPGLLREPASYQVPDDRPVAVDLGCGTGILATVLALRFRGSHVIATDRSAAACASARATLAANGVRAAVLRDDAGSELPDACADLVLLNPPFHDRAALSTDAAHRMFATAGRILRDGGELWTVFNTPLRYRGALERAVGPTEHIAQNRKFTVTRSVRKLLTDLSVIDG
ncbi:class I SAM-dependent methyltransferase [Promicromonospora sp. MS192]|uniref:class I SAM-dependent methyltransferase n=1 Tax=Promicromonospora sp. MS192 TaxID=3412684 RepID=UPI003C2E816F